MSARHASLKLLFEGVFWPAAAGNVFWAFCALIVDKTVCLTSPDVVARLAVLLLLAIYLSVEWLRNYRNLPDEVPWKFWLFDWFHICAVVFVALTASVRVEWLSDASIVFFAVTAAGHIGAWEAAEASWIERGKSGLINLSGVLIIGFGAFMQPWHLPLGFLVVLGLWIFHRRVAIRKLFASG